MKLPKPYMINSCLVGFITGYFHANGLELIIIATVYSFVSMSYAEFYEKKWSETKKVLPEGGSL